MSVYDPRTPVRPTPEGTHVVDGITMTAGRDHVHDACTDLLNRQVPLGCDIETVGVNSLSFHIKVVTFGTPDTAVALDPRDNMQLAEIRRLVEHAPALIFHNATFDIPPMHRWGMITLDEIDKVHDTIVYARMATTLKLAPKDLTACAKRHLGLELDTQNTIQRAFKAAGYKDQSDGWAGMDISSPVYLRGAMMDTAVTAALAPAVWRAAFEQLTQGHPFTEFGVTPVEAERLIEREQIVNRVMLKRSARGLPVDLDFLDRHRDQHAANMLAIERDLQAVGINPGNGNHLTKYLEAQGALPPDWPCTKTGQLSATAKHLETLRHPIAVQFIEHKQATKIATYLQQVEDGSRATGRLHPTVNILGASATGRMSYSTPPLQQFPGDARPMILAEDGHEMTSIDFKAIEPVVAATMAGDRALLDPYARGEDIYVPAMNAAGVDRKTAKVVMLARMYSQGNAALAVRLNMTEDQAREVQHQIMSAFPAMTKFLHKVRTIGGNYGKVISGAGRILDLPRAPEGGFMAHKASNFTIQSTSYDLISEAIVEMNRRGIADSLVLVMHDEIVVDDAAEEVADIMRQTPEWLHKWAAFDPVILTDTNVTGRTWKYV